MNNDILRDYLITLVNGLEQEEEEQINSIKSCIARLEVGLESLQTARYDRSRYGFPYTTDEQFDVMIAHYQHELERSRINLLEYSSKSLVFSKRLCERLMANAISHRTVIEEMMEMSLINENEYNEQSKKLMNHYNNLKEIIDMYGKVDSYP
jgi:hypothetical protein